MKEPLKDCKVCGETQTSMSRNANCWKESMCYICFYHAPEPEFTLEVSVLERRKFNYVDSYWDTLTVRELERSQRRNYFAS